MTDENQNEVPEREDGPGRSGGGSSDAKGAKRVANERNRPNGFLLVTLLLSILVVVAWLEDDRGGVERREHAVIQLLQEGALDPESLVLLRDTGEFWARLKLNKDGQPLHKDGKPLAAEGVRRVVLKLATEEALFEFKKNYIDPLGAVGISAQTKDSNNKAWEFFFNFVPWILILVVLYFVFFRQLRSPGGPGGGILNFGRSRAKIASQDQTGITFADVAGADEAKREVSEIVEFLRNPKKFQRLGGRIPRGVMLVGSPGTGKTLIAKAIAGEAGVPFFSICGSDFVEMFVGVGAARVRDLFKQARESSPCIVFLDEVDAVGRRRGAGLGGGHDEREQTLNAILVEMDGFESDEGVIVVAATNRPDVLDPALLRPGRFDRQVTLDLPDVDGREAILIVHATDVRLHPSVNLRRIARGTPGFSGAELAAIMNEAALLAALRDQDSVVEKDLEDARDRIRFGLQKKSRAMLHEDKLITAYHEAGHAIIAHLLDEVEPLHKVTIIPRGMALGLTMQLPERDRFHLSRKQILGTLKLLYGGRIAEEIFCDDITSGASSDIDRATDLARRMVCEWGMSEKLGPIKYTENEETLFLGREVTKSRDHSEDLARRIDEELRGIVDDTYNESKRIIEEHRDDVERIAMALMERESLTGEEVARVVRGETLEPLVEDDAAPSDVAPSGEGETEDGCDAPAAALNSIASESAELSDKREKKVSAADFVADSSPATDES